MKQIIEKDSWGGGEEREEARKIRTTTTEEKMTRIKPGTKVVLKSSLD